MRVENGNMGMDEGRIVVGGKRGGGRDRGRTRGSILVRKGRSGKGFRRRRRGGVAWRIIGEGGCTVWESSGGRGIRTVGRASFDRAAKPSSGQIAVQLLDRHGNAKSLELRTVMRTDVDRRTRARQTRAPSGGRRPLSRAGER